MSETDSSLSNMKTQSTMNNNKNAASELRISNHTSSEEAGIKKLEGGNNIDMLSISNTTSDNAVPDSIQNVQSNKEKSA